MSTVTSSSWPSLAPGETTANLSEEKPRDQANHSTENLFQAQRWEAIGRLTGGVVHDFNNLLTGVMLYCDLLLASLDARDCRRRYAGEIRSAIVQSSGLVQQLLVFARPQEVAASTLNLNEIVRSLQALLSRLIGENIALDLQLDPQLGNVNLAPCLAQQILLNLVLNARDALPNGGQISVETSNCYFHSVPRGEGRRQSFSAFPCILLAVGDNGHGMDAETRRRLFEPFFTTKAGGKGSGLGLTTVRSIVTTNQGLIHFESEPGCGTRAMVLLPRVSGLSDAGHSTSASLPPASPTTFQDAKKDLFL
jgi:two-component system, cell cycle sensor histidine kinase and response regulator CckA